MTLFTLYCAADKGNFKQTVDAWFRGEREVGQFYRLLKYFSMLAGNTHGAQITLSDNTSPGIQTKLHFRNLLVNLLHELNNKVDQLVLQHRLRMEVCNEERDVVASYWLPP